MTASDLALDPGALRERSRVERDEQHVEVAGEREGSLGRPDLVPARDS